MTAVSDDGFQTIEGNLGKAVVSQTHSYADGEVLGYGLLPNASEKPETPEDTEKQPLCGLEEHTHDENCYDESGALTCTLPEHTHTDACYQAVGLDTYEFSYADSQLSLRLYVEPCRRLYMTTILTRRIKNICKTLMTACFRLYAKRIPGCR